MKYLFILLALVAFSADADQVARNGDDMIVLMDKQCPYAEVQIRLQQAPDGDKYQKADTRINGKRFFACWRSVIDVVHLVYEDGDQGLVPAAFFEEDPGA
jgi:hypothetical protein